MMSFPASTEGEPTRRAVLTAMAAAAGLGRALGHMRPRTRRETAPEGAEELAAFVRADRRAVDELGLGEGALPVRDELEDVTVERPEPVASSSKD